MDIMDAVDYMDSASEIRPPCPRRPQSRISFDIFPECGNLFPLSYGDDKSSKSESLLFKMLSDVRLNQLSGNVLCPLVEKNQLLLFWAEIMIVLFNISLKIEHKCLDNRLPILDFSTGMVEMITRHDIKFAPKHVNKRIFPEIIMMPGRKNKPR
jgi:hypothetical protein